MRECPISGLQQFYELARLYSGVRDFLRNEHDIKNGAVALAHGPLMRRTLNGEHVVAFGLHREPLVCTIEDRKLPIVFEKELVTPSREIDLYHELCDRLILDGELGALTRYAAGSATHGFIGIAEAATRMIYTLQPGDRLDERCISMGLQKGAPALDRPYAIDGIRITYHETSLSAKNISQNQLLRAFSRFYRKELQPIIGVPECIAASCDKVSVYVPQIVEHLPMVFSHGGKEYPIMYRPRRRID